MQNFSRLTDITAVSFDNRLMPQTMPMIGNLPRSRVSSSGIQPASLGTPGPGRALAPDFSLSPGDR